MLSMRRARRWAHSSRNDELETVLGFCRCRRRHKNVINAAAKNIIELTMMGVVTPKAGINAAPAAVYTRGSFLYIGSGIHMVFALNKRKC